VYQIVLTYGNFTIFKMADFRHFEFYGPCGTYYMSSVDTISKSLSFLEKIAFLCTHFGNRQTYRRTDGQTDKQMDRTNE